MNKDVQNKKAIRNRWPSPATPPRPRPCLKCLDEIGGEAGK